MNRLQTPYFIPLQLVGTTLDRHSNGRLEFWNISTLKYRDFRNSDRPEEFTEAYWQILVARLAFIVVFENLVVFLSWLVMYLIPDIPYYVTLQILREKYLSREALLAADVIKDRKREDQKNNAENSQLY
ncbi:hypothetical protein ScPMuIL_012946 [Solemya velum]